MDSAQYISQIKMPMPESHKGQNGRVLVIGGSKLFHAAAFWAAAMASKIVDLVHFSSPAMENNELMRVRAKSKFWDGIVVPWEDIDRYIEEDDSILIGPGMPRHEGLMEGEVRTDEIVNKLLTKYGHKKWVVDGGALQEVKTKLLQPQMILTPNQRELEILYTQVKAENVGKLAEKLGGLTILAKGKADIVSNGKETVEIAGGNAGMTKGGTGDVLAGLVTALYAKSPAIVACVAASRIAKEASDRSREKQGLFYSVADLIPEIQVAIKSDTES